MDNKMQFNVLEVIEKIHLRSKDSLLKPALFEELETELNLFSAYLHTDTLTALIFANAFTLWYTDNSFNEVFKYFGMNEFLDVLKHRTHIELLFERNLLINRRARNRQINTFDVPQSIINCISKGQEIPSNLVETETADFADVLQEFDRFSDAFDEEAICLSELVNEIKTLIEDHRNFPFFEKMHSWKLSHFESFFLLDTIWDALNHGDNRYNTDVSSTVNDFYTKKSMALKNITAIINGETKLTALKLIDVEKSRFGNQAKARLSKGLLNLLKQTQNIEIDFLEAENSSLMLYKKITKRSLFYNQAEFHQIAMLKDILIEAKFSAIGKRLSRKGMPGGITVLFHGAPGTGKTESVYQLAKESGRNIFKVDISQTRNMWFGESEKLIKKIFTDYATLKAEEKHCPILLFNEADAVISKRKTAGSSNVADTENSIQNIILEELENFDGILFATTNLVSNMDSAFERRFLFKVLFAAPAPENAARIWQSKLPFLSESESLHLAESFAFSGGEMENIARKCTMHEILHGKHSDFDLVKQFCHEEKWGTTPVSKIGF